MAVALGALLVGVMLIPELYSAHGTLGTQSRLGGHGTQPGVRMPLLGGFGLFWLVEHLPGLDVVQNQRAHFVFELAVALLAGFGLQAVLDRPRDARWRLAVPLVALVAIVSIGPSATHVNHTIDHFVKGTDFRAPSVLALTSVGWLLVNDVMRGVVVAAGDHEIVWSYRVPGLGLGLLLSLLALTACLASAVVLLLRRRSAGAKVSDGDPTT